MKEPSDSNSNEYGINSYDYLETPKKKRLFQKILSGLGIGGAIVGGWVAMVIQFILYGSVAVLGLGVVVRGISLIVNGRIWSGLATIFIWAPIVVGIGYFILTLVLSLIGGAIALIWAGIYYLIKGIGKLFSRNKWLGKGE